MSELYSEDQVQQILQHALARRAKSGQALTREQVGEIATELGVSREDFLAAEQEWLAKRELNSDRAVFDDYQKKKFRDSLFVYAIVNGFLVAFNLLASGTVTWALYPILGWGLGLALKGWSTFQTDSEAYEKAFAKWQLKQKRDKLAADFVSGVTKVAAKKVEEWLN